MAGHKLWIVCGEISGDMHAAALLRALREREPELRAAGIGGDELAAAGMEVTIPVSRLSVMGVTEVAARLFDILRVLRRIKRELRAARPDAVVCVDAPALNFRVMRMARSLGVPVYYYISPKIWAWNTGRAEFIRRNARRVLCILPFEAEFYARRGVEVDYVGNPLLDAMDIEALRAKGPVPGRVGLLPGSRRREYEVLTPLLGQTARILKRRFPHLHFEAVRAPGVPLERLRALWPDELEFEIHPPERRHRRMARWDACVAASGTATLETALLGVPTIATYKVSAVSAALMRRVIKVPYVSLANLVLNEEVFPELLQERCEPQHLAAAAAAWLESPDAAAATRRRLDELRRIMGGPGASKRAAEIILRGLGAEKPAGS